MDKFREAYRKAAGELPEFRMEAQKVQDELQHHRMRQPGRKRTLTKGCAAAAVLLLCSAGTAAAKNYHDSVISLRDDGFTITSAQETGKEKMASDIEMGVMKSLPISDGPLAEGYAAEHIVEYAEYNSLQEFLQEEELAIAIPDLSAFHAVFGQEYIAVTGGKDVFISLTGENCSFNMQQFDNRDCECYSSATSYGGKNANERSYTGRQGISYVIFDILDEMGRVESTHAALSINGRDLAIDFRGFEESVIHEILNSMDLTVYYEQ